MDELVRAVVCVRPFKVCVHMAGASGTHYFHWMEDSELFAIIDGTSSQVFSLNVHAFLSTNIRSANVLACRLHSTVHAKLNSTFGTVHLAEECTNAWFCKEIPLQKLRNETAQFLLMMYGMLSPSPKPNEEEESNEKWRMQLAVTAQAHCMREHHIESFTIYFVVSHLQASTLDAPTSVLRSLSLRMNRRQQWMDTLNSVHNGSSDKSPSKYANVKCLVNAKRDAWERNLFMANKRQLIKY